MSPTTGPKPLPESPSAERAPPPPRETAREASARERDEPRSIALLALHSVVVRVGWIFKTESVIIPAFLDSIAGPAWMRGLLPVFNRTGQSVPAFLLSRRIKVTPLKKHALLLSCLGMAAPFLLLSALLGGAADRPVWLPAAFLALYGIFFGFAGLNQIVWGTLSGKQVRAQRRGRLMTISTFGGTVPAVLLAWWLLPGWLSGPRASYAAIFFFAGACFTLAAGLALAIREPRDRHEEAASSVGAQLRGAWQILRDNPNYRRLVVVGTLFSSSIMIFPHFQALARERLDLVGANLMLWVVAQNVAMGLASLVMGPVADRFGNRLTLRVVVFAGAAIPPLAIALTHLEPETGRRLFPLVFVGIGLTPIGFRVLTNYVLEVSPPAEHPRYLSLSQLCTAAVFVVSPLLGLLLDVTSFEVVFGLQAAIMLIGGFLTFGLVEPRSELLRSRSG